MDEFDVVCVDDKSNTVQWVDGPHSSSSADAVIKMAIMRQGVTDRFFAAVKHGRYHANDAWDGGSEDVGPETSKDGRLVKCGNMWFPNGPRGL